MAEGGREMKSEERQVRGLLKKIAQSQKKIAAERDRLREIYDDLGSVLDSIDLAQQSFAQGMAELEDGLDTISQYL